MFFYGMTLCLKMSDEEDDDVIIACTSVIIACAGIVGTVALSQKKTQTQILGTGVYL